MTYYEFLSLRFDFCRFIREAINKEHLAQKYSSLITMDKYYFIGNPPFKDFITDRMRVLYEMHVNIDSEELMCSQEIIDATIEELKVLKRIGGFYYENYLFDIEKYKKERV